MKYTEPGGHIWITAVKDRNDVVIRVRDTARFATQAVAKMNSSPYWLTNCAIRSRLSWPPQRFDLLLDWLDHLGARTTPEAAARIACSE